MARKTIAERIAQLDAQKKALQARAGKQERADDTRRAGLFGECRRRARSASIGKRRRRRVLETPRRLVAPRAAGLPLPRIRQDVVRRSARCF